jgi:SOS-response transcriptional repressor LexA
VHRLQQELLKLAEEKNLGKLTLRAIGAMVGEESPQKIKHHLHQLEMRGLIRVDKPGKRIQKVKRGWVTSSLSNARLLSIPILGSANAGPAAVFADANIEGYLKISSTFFGRRSNRKLFALKVSGPSMNRAEIDGQRIESGDFAIIDSEDRTPEDGDIIISVIDGMANIKRFHRDGSNKQIALVSDSTHDFSPIYIHEDDDFVINGKVVHIVKRPKP